MHLAPHRLAAGLRIASLSCIGAAILVPGDSRAQTSALGASPWQSIDYAQVRLIAAQDRVGGGVELDVALHVRLDPGWHTYWRADGGVGFPPRIDWSGSANLSRLDITWPAPHRIFTYGYEAIGYENEVVFPMRATLTETGAPLHLRLDTMIAVCRDICIPFETSLTLELPAGTASTTPYARLIERYADRVPRRYAMPGFEIETVRLVSHEAGTAIEIGARAEPPFDTPEGLIPLTPV